MPSQDGRRFRVLAVVDDYTRDCLCPRRGYLALGIRVVRELDAIIARRGGHRRSYLTRHRAHNRWPSCAGVSKPVSSGITSRRESDAERFIESFNGRFRDECLTKRSSRHSWRPPRSNPIMEGGLQPAPPPLGPRQQNTRRIRRTNPSGNQGRIGPKSTLGLSHNRRKVGAQVRLNMPTSLIHRPPPRDLRKPVYLTESGQRGGTRRGRLNNHGLGWVAGAGTYNGIRRTATWAGLWARPVSRPDVLRCSYSRGCWSATRPYYP